MIRAVFFIKGPAAELAIMRFIRWKEPGNRKETERMTANLSEKGEKGKWNIQSKG